MFRRWLKMPVQDSQYNGEGEVRHSFDLGDLASIGVGGGEFAHLAESLYLSERDRQPVINMTSQSDPAAFRYHGLR
jgi:hypothetical protein